MTARISLLLLCLILPFSRATAQDAARAPSWMMPKVEAANLSYRTFDSKLAGQQVSYLLYLPPGYETSGARRFPVVYWLHGIGGSQQGVPAMTARITEAIQAGKCPPFIVVFANGMRDSFYCDAAKAPLPVEGVIVKELVPHVDATQRTVAARQGRMIEGFSMGGFGAGRLGFKHPEVFGSVSMIDGALLDLDTLRRRHPAQFERIFGGDAAAFLASHPGELAERNAASLRGRSLVRLVVGTLAQPNEVMHRKLLGLGIEHEYDVFADAGHNAATLYRRLGDRNWEFYRRAFAPTEAASPASAPSLPPPVPPRAGGLEINGERWTYREGEFEMGGILLKPPGKGPFPAVLISHGMGGSAQSFGLVKAREMVQWGMVCIAPDYTHGLNDARGGAARPPPSALGATAENLRRAETCVRLLGQMPEVDGARIAAYGHSMGGFVTIGLAARQPTLLRACAITGSGVAPREGFSAPSESSAEKIRTPFLILHGAQDMTVRPSQSEALKRILDRNRVPNSRQVFDGHQHPIDQSMRAECFRLLRDWFLAQGVVKEEKPAGSGR